MDCCQVEIQGAVGLTQIIIFNTLEPVFPCCEIGENSSITSAPIEDNTESKNHRPDQIGKDLTRSPDLTFHRKRGA